jgi:light-regulated signal transduction histidine kinase (bacteriophytochrome)
MTLRTLIDGLLDFSRTARTRLQQTEGDFGALANDVILELKADGRDRDIIWPIAKVPAVRGDATMLKVALGNVISNAIKFTRGRRQVIIEIRQAAGDPGQAVGFVRDNGARFDMRSEQAAQRTSTAARRRRIRGNWHWTCRRAAHYQPPRRKNVARGPHRRRSRALPGAAEHPQQSEDS